jgi:hypothetical protein
MARYSSCSAFDSASVSRAEAAVAARAFLRVERSQFGQARLARLGARVAEAARDLLAREPDEGVVGEHLLRHGERRPFEVDRAQIAVRVLAPRAPARRVGPCR